MLNPSNIINLFADDAHCTPGGSQVAGRNNPKSINMPGDNQPPADTPIQLETEPTSLTVSTVPQSREDRETMVEIEERLYRYPAIAQATAFRYESGNGNTGYGAAVVLFDWIEKVTVPDIKKWIVAHLDSATLQIEIVKVEPGLFAK